MLKVILLAHYSSTVSRDALSRQEPVSAALPSETENHSPFFNYPTAGLQGLQEESYR